jgi:hypothetical protein
MSEDRHPHHQISNPIHNTMKRLLSFLAKDWSNYRLKEDARLREIESTINQLQAEALRLEFTISELRETLLVLKGANNQLRDSIRRLKDSSRSSGFQVPQQLRRSFLN